MTRTNELARKISAFLDLKLNIQAVRFIENESEVPEGTVAAGRDIGHLALCQAFALAKREGKTVYTTKYSEWCWTPLIALGYVECRPGTEAFEEISRNMGIEDMDEARRFFENFPTLPLGKYSGVLIAPAATADFSPDVLLINCDNNFQLRTLLWAIKHKTGKMLDVSLDPIDSCIYTLVKSMITREYTVAIPDPGEQERALSDKNEIILGVPAERLEALAEGCDFLASHRIGYRDMQMQMQFDFERPPFYNRLYEIWGLEQGKSWSRGDMEK